MKPGELEIVCARFERRIQKRISSALLLYMKKRVIAQMGFSGDLVNAQNSTIEGQSFVLRLSGCTPLGNPIHIEIEISHDDSWIPFIVISSTEADEPVTIVAERDDDIAIEAVTAVLDEIIQSAISRSEYERSHLPELLQGRTEFTIYN